MDTRRTRRGGLLMAAGIPLAVTGLVASGIRLGTLTTFGVNAICLAS